MKSLKAMSDDSIKTAEEQLHSLVTEANAVLVKLKKTLNVFLYIAIPVVITFFLSFVDVRSRMSTMEESKLSKEEAEAKYATKAGVIFLQNDVYDMNNANFTMKDNATEEKMEKAYTKALRQFNGDVNRSESAVN